MNLFPHVIQCFNMENTPLTYIFKLTGIIIVQFNSKAPKYQNLIRFLWPLMFHSIHLYILIIGLWSLHYITYDGITYVLKYVDTIFLGYCELYLCISVFHCYKRSRKLQYILTRLSEMEKELCLNKYTTFNKKFEIFRLGLLFIKIFYIPFMTVTLIIPMIAYISMIVMYLDQLYCRLIFTQLHQHFREINGRLNRLTNSVDLKMIFPFTKKRKIEQLIQEETVLSIKQIQNCSHVHYRLTRLASDLNDLFAITISASMVLAFAAIIDYLFYLVTMAQKNQEKFIVFFVYAIAHILFHFLWIFVTINNFSKIQYEVLH